MKRKLIEVALPLAAINAAALTEKSLRGGHPANLHPWWARRPLTACRAVVFASLVDDPSADPERFSTDKAVRDERDRLFRIIEELVVWENTTNEDVLERARAEIRRCSDGNLPPVLDPFCGGGSIPLEAQRLGLTTYASDLNPVAVLITKALIEIPSLFANQPPVHPDARRGVGGTGAWKGAAGLAEDVRRYGTWMRDEAERRIGHLFPCVDLPRSLGGGKAPVIAWIWTRMATCPNPACGAEMPLAHSYSLSMKNGSGAWVVPSVDTASRTVSFAIGGPSGSPPEAPKTGRGSAFRCIVCGHVASESHIRSEGRAGRLGFKLMAIAAEGGRGRVYVAPDAEQTRIAESARPTWSPTQAIATNPRWFSPPGYGLTTFADLFSPRQLAVLATLTDLTQEVRSLVAQDAMAAGLPSDDTRLATGGNGPSAYADAVATYLALVVDKMAETNVTLAVWKLDRECAVKAFGRQAMSMAWDYPESNPFGESAGSWRSAMSLFLRSFDGISMPATRPAVVVQRDARDAVDVIEPAVITDPPYYDNIGYSDLSDFHYVWLRRSLEGIWPDLLSTLLTPKTDELIASAHRFGGDKEQARNHFETGLGAVFRNLRRSSSSTYPTVIFYAFKQAESSTGSDSAVASTGWETMLQGLLQAGYSIDGTWPIRTETTSALKAETNVLATSIVLVCRPRSADSGITTRKDLVAALRRELPEALRALQQGNIAPVDLAQASIGPGMAVYSRYAKVLEPDGSPMRVRTALALINAALDEILSEQEGEFDADTRWAIAWYEQFGLSESAYGTAETLSKAKNSSVAGLVEAGIVAASRGRVRLLARDEYTADWDPAKDLRVPVWEATQRLVHVLLTDGEAAAGDLLARLGGLGDTARDLAYRMYHVAERKGWPDEARAYNALVVAWTDLARGAESSRAAQPAQASLGLK